jgi:hypothetical protein
MVFTRPCFPRRDATEAHVAFVPNTLPAPPGTAEQSRARDAFGTWIFYDPPAGTVQCTC